jgi:hypothetical protein
MPFVMGTTGYDEEACRAAIGEDHYAVLAPNMGKPIVLFQSMLKHAAETFPGGLDGYTLRCVESHQASHPPPATCPSLQLGQCGYLTGGRHRIAGGQGGHLGHGQGCGEPCLASLHHTAPMPLAEPPHDADTSQLPARSSVRWRIQYSCAWGGGFSQDGTVGRWAPWRSSRTPLSAKRCACWCSTAARCLPQTDSISCYNGMGDNVPAMA